MTHQTQIKTKSAHPMLTGLACTGGIIALGIAVYASSGVHGGGRDTPVTSSLGFAAFGSGGEQDQTKPTVRTENCTTSGCHSDVVSHKNLHGPVAQQDCLSCHEYALEEQHLFRFITPKNQLCSSCHTLNNHSIVHEPVLKNNCTGCHDPHGSEQKMLLIKPPDNGLCLTCHQSILSDKAFVHGPAAVEACLVCHNAHSSSTPGLLTMSPDKLCLDCHSEMKPDRLSARHLHKPMIEGCTSCHDPHASDAKFQLHSATPGLCLNCHEGVKHDLESAAVIHGPIQDAGGCTACHNPHFSPLPRLQKLAQPELCLSCHNQTLKTSDGRSVANMSKLLKDNPNHHGPIRDGNCTACHQPHAAEHFRLLLEDYPAQFYAPFDLKRYDLCFSCHLSDMVTDESGTGLTGFRDGDVNLHWLHVNKEKGRTCRACHEVHASSLPFHIRDAVPFGSSGWMLKINYEQNEMGGSCAPGCHQKKTYDRTRRFDEGDNQTDQQAGD